MCMRWTQALGRNRRLLGERMLAVGRVLAMVTVDRAAVTGAMGDRKDRAEFEELLSREREVKPYACIQVGAVGCS